MNGDTMDPEKRNPTPGSSVSDPSASGRGSTGSTPAEWETSGPELHVPESDTRDLRLIDRSDLIFAGVYAALFIWGLVLTLLAV